MWKKKKEGKKKKSNGLMPRHRPGMPTAATRGMQRLDRCAPAEGARAAGAGWSREGDVLTTNMQTSNDTSGSKLLMY